MKNNSKAAFIVYCVYQKFKNEKNIVSISYKDFEEHYGLHTVTVKAANNLLLQLGLLVEVDENGNEVVKKNDGPKVVSFKKTFYRVVDAPRLSEEEGRKLFEKNGLCYDTDFREKYSKPPKAYERMYDYELMKDLYDQIGEKIFDVNIVAGKLGLDRNMLINCLENTTFRQKVEAVREKIVGQEKLQEINSSKKFRRTKRKVTVSEGVKTLMDCHLKDGQPIPRANWNVQQLLRYFAVLYHRTYGVHYRFSNQPFSSKEAKDIKQIFDAFEQNGELAASYLDYVFDKKVQQFDRPISTGLLAHPRMINEYEALRVKAGGKIYRHAIKNTDLIDESFMIWIRENLPDIFDELSIKTMRDLYWAKNAVLEDSASEKIKQLVKEAEERGIIPKGKENIKFLKEK